MKRMGRIGIIAAICLFIPVLLFARVGVDSTGEKVVLTGLFDGAGNIVSNVVLVNSDGAGLTGITAAQVGAYPNASGVAASNLAASALATNGDASSLTNFPAFVVLTNNTKLLAAITNETYLGTLTNVVVNNVTGTVAMGVATLTITAGAGDLKADGSVPMSGNFNFGGKEGTNASLFQGSTGTFANLQITAGATNNGIFVCTNSTTGQGIWRILPKISVAKTTGQLFPHGVRTTITDWNVTNHIVGGIFDGTSWTPGIGWVHINVCVGVAAAIARTGTTELTLHKNSSAALDFQSSTLYVSSVVNPNTAANWLFYNSNATNAYQIKFVQGYGVGITNEGMAVYTYFNGAVLP